MAPALAGLVMLAVGIALAPLVAALVRRLVPERRVVFARWGFSHVVGAVLVGALAFVATLLWHRPDPEEVDVLAELFRTVFVQGAVACYVVLAAWRLDPEGETSLGWRADGLVRALLAAVAAYVILFPTLWGAMVLWPWALEALGQDVAQQLVLERFPGPDSPALPYAIVLTVVVVPLLEEVLFRGFLQPLLVQNLSDKLGVVLTSVVFALLHGTTPFLPIFCLSLLLGGLMLRTQRLGAVWAVHALHNGLMLLAMLSAQAGGEPPG